MNKLEMYLLTTIEMYIFNKEQNDINISGSTIEERRIRRDQTEKLKKRNFKMFE